MDVGGGNDLLLAQILKGIQSCVAFWLTKRKFWNAPVNAFSKSMTFPWIPASRREVIGRTQAEITACCTTTPNRR